MKPSFADGQIAAIAATQGLVLVTGNIRDFEVFDGLQLVNWLEEPAAAIAVGVDHPPQHLKQPGQAADLAH